jgi:hypothetical protein
LVVGLFRQLFGFFDGFFECGFEVGHDAVSLALRGG